MSQPTQIRYTSTLPDGTPLTMDHIRADGLVQIYVGSWPYDTAFAVVLEVRERVLCRFEVGGQTRWTPRKRIASLLRAVPDDRSDAGPLPA
ncbi:hypothetical protein OHA02_14780 [Streptomyces phaeochromogenes]|nr:hypothetical protein [Streptomyces phaeochromogenes]